MNYKIVSSNNNLLNKIKHNCNVLSLKESIHIQEVNILFIDVKNLDNASITSYRNLKEYTHLLFFVNDSYEIKKCLDNEFLNYIHINFLDEELIYWLKYFLKNKKENIHYFEENLKIDFNKSQIISHNNIIQLTFKEMSLLKELSSIKYISTNTLMKSLNLNSSTSIRTIINRIRNKTPINLILQKRNFGYKLLASKEKEKIKTQKLKDLEEQNILMQEIIDSSPIFIATFIHKQLFCINKSFRDFLGNEIIKELWDETKGDFFQLIKSTSKNKKVIKEELFSIGEKNIDLYDFTKHSSNSFLVKTFYFENIDKHLLIFTLYQ